MSHKITELFDIKYPIVQAGMIWASGWRLASAVANAGGLGLIGAGSMYPEVLREHIQKCKNATSASFGVNVPMLYPQIEAIMDIIAGEGVKIVFTSAGNPKTWTPFLKEHGITVVIAQRTGLGQRLTDADLRQGIRTANHVRRQLRKLRELVYCAGTSPLPALEMQIAEMLAI
ncbi:MAG: nitronate monooxygenase, partial [Robiginitalea sp.]|nr:nitronate monooxygenase [Robiginitalea sp.]